MKTADGALKAVHWLLFRALIEMRAQGHEQKNKMVFHLEPIRLTPCACK
jgi:hypothetical protein